MKYLVLVFVCMIFGGCSKEQRSSVVCSYQIDVDKAIVSNLFDAVDSVDFIQLETNNDNLISEIGQLAISDNIVLSDRRTNQLLQFTLDGRHLSTLSNIGNGPGEYVRLDAFLVDKENGDIMILDAMQNKVIVYSKEGAFLREVNTPLPYGPGFFAKSAQNKYFVFEQSITSVMAESNYNLFVCSEDMSNPVKLLPFTKTSNVAFSPRTIFYYVNDTLVYVPTYQETIYNVFEDRVEPRLRIDFGDKWVDDEYVYNPNIANDPIGFVEGLEKQRFVYFFNELENDTHIYADFYYQGVPYLYIYNKQTGVYQLLKAREKEGFELRDKPLFALSDRFVIPITSSALKGILDDPSIKFNEKEALNQQFKALDEESNPILISVKFK